MQIVKRNGNRETVKLEKISARIRKLTYELNPKFVDYNEVAVRTVQGLYDGVSTSEIDTLAAETAASLTGHHPDYSILAARIALTALHKETPSTFSEAMEKLNDFVNKETDENCSILNEVFIDNVRKNAAALNAMVVDDRDFKIKYFGYKTLERSYLKKINGKVVERPQYMYMRVAVGIWGDDLENVQKTYDLLSQGYLSHATPTMFNAGTKLGSYNSCFLVANKGDDIHNLFETISDCAKMSKVAGGLGLHIHNVRAKGSFIRGTNGKSDGVIPYMKTLNEMTRWINQGGMRKGSMAVYLEPWHADIFEFVQAKNPTGDENMRARDLFLALWVPDLFMKRVKENGNWSLFCPDQCPGLSDVYDDGVENEFTLLYEQYEKEGRARRVVKARDLMSHILSNQIESGTPYVLYKDAVNHKTNQKNLGTTKSSNLCVAPETLILTSEGNREISSLEDQWVDVWNGEEWSRVKVVKTGENEKLIQLNFNNGLSLWCTPYHKFAVQVKKNKYTNVKVIDKPACELTTDDILIDFNLPVLNSDKELDNAYTRGFFAGDGSSNTNTRDHLDLYHGKNDLAKFLNIYPTGNYNHKVKRQRYCLNFEVKDKFFVPIGYSLNSKLEWLSGFLDADGCLLTNKWGYSLQAISVHIDFLQKIVCLLQEMGVKSSVVPFMDEGYRLMPDGKGGEKNYLCKKAYRIVISSYAFYQLKQLGLKMNRLKTEDFTPNRSAVRFVKLKSVSPETRIDDTFCFTEPKRQMGVFNGLVSRQCSETTLFSSYDEVGVCVLASMCLPKYVDRKTKKFNYEKLGEDVRQAARNLNRIIDVSTYPTKETKNSNLLRRPVGIGVQGLADVFALLRISPESPKARGINQAIFETIYYFSVDESAELARIEGSYTGFEGSPASKGILQPDLWKSSIITGYDWDGLRKKVMGGLRNSLSTCQMPTASSASILDNNEAAEFYTSNLYKRNTLGGEFIMVNRHLVHELVELNLWNDNIRLKLIQGDGSIQNIEEIPAEVRARYKTVWELPVKLTIDMAADRGAFICQSQSMNLFIADVNIAKLNAAHFYGWEKGLKTGMYYLRTQKKLSAMKGLGVDLTSLRDKVVEVEKDGVACSLDNPAGCESCSS